VLHRSKQIGRDTSARIADTCGRALLAWVAAAPPTHLWRSSGGLRESRPMTCCSSSTGPTRGCRTGHAMA